MAAPNPLIKPHGVPWRKHARGLRRRIAHRDARLNRRNAVDPNGFALRWGRHWAGADAR